MELIQSQSYVKVNIWKKILVVDDEKPISDIIKFNMAKEGYEVLTAFDGKEALEMFEAEQPDILILDLMLPEVDGLEVKPDYSVRPAMFRLLYCLLRTSEFDKVIGLEIGADDYVTKPFSNRELQARVKGTSSSGRPCCGKPSRRKWPERADHWGTADFARCFCC